MTDKNLLKIAQDFGTPTYVYDAESIKTQYEKLTSSFTKNTRFFYAAKALTNINILKYIKSLGASLDCVSVNEVKLGIKAGFTVDKILYTPNCVDFSEIEEAVALKVHVNIGLKGDFAPWVGSMIVDVKQPILLISDENTEEEVITRLSRVGFDNVIGYLKGGFGSWKESGKESDTVNRISPEEFAQEFTKNSKVIDVRKPTEYEASHVDEAYSRPLADISDWLSTFKNEEDFYIYCGGGYRSMIAASILNSHGIRNFKEIEGGFGKIKETSVPKSDFVCQSKTL